MNQSIMRAATPFEELLIAEGSDWCWWYGPEHDSANRPEFDRLYRDHLANVYRALGMTPPDELSRPILKLHVAEFHEPPSGPIQPTIDGEVTSYFEWLGAGCYHVDSRSGAMHGQRFLIRELDYGSNGSHFFLRIDFESGAAELAATDVKIRIVAASDPAKESSFTLSYANGELTPAELKFADYGGLGPVTCAFRKVLEASVSLHALGVQRGESLRFQLSLWRDGLPLDALPQQGWLEISTADPSDWPL